MKSRATQAHASAIAARNHHDASRRARADGVSAHDVVRDQSHAVQLVKLHRRIGSAKRRRRIPKPRFPKQLEVSYAQQLLGVVATARKHVQPLLDKLPSLLPSESIRTDGGIFLRSELEYIDNGLAYRLATFQGIPLVIENAKGTTREWHDSNGESGETVMQADYGYIPGTVGDDGEELDVYVGDNSDAAWVYVVEQMKKSSNFTEPDEQKVMLGFASAREAAETYYAQYDDPRFLGSMNAIELGEFKRSITLRAEAKLTRTDANDEASKAKALIEMARAKLADAIHPNNIEALAKKIAERTSETSKAQIHAETKAALGIELHTLDKKLPKLIRGFVGENVELIKGLSDDTMNKIAQMTTRAFTTGTRHEELAADIEKRFGIAERHAKLIARDQVGKLNAQVTRSRHEELGVSKYIWRTSNDDLVRDEHAVLEGEEFEYDNPDTDGEGNPGDAINCRCGAEPVFAELQDALDENAVDGGGDEESHDESNSGDDQDEEDLSDDKTNAETPANQDDHDEAQSAMLEARAARQAASEADYADNPEAARIASRAASASKKTAEAAAKRAEARASDSPAAKHLAGRAREAADQADIDARQARRNADSLSRRASGRFKR